MKITITTKHSVEINFYWYGSFSIRENFFFSKNLIDLGTMKEIQEMLPNAFKYDFYKEGGVDKVIATVTPNLDIQIS